MVSHLDIFYQTRGSIAINNSDPSKASTAGLNYVPKAAEIRYDSGVKRFIDSESFEAPNGKGFETAQFFIGRALIDPDATVVPV